jgi:hypothetical protein
MVRGDDESSLQHVALETVGIGMNYILGLLPDFVSSASEPTAIFVWGIALVLLSSWRPHASRAGVAQQIAAPQRPTESPLVARVS